MYHPKGFCHDRRFASRWLFLHNREEDHVFASRDLVLLSHVAYLRPDGLAAFRGSDHLGGVLSGLPVVTITTAGARTGNTRSVSLISIPEGDELILIASNWGRPRHPSWYHNLKANPQVTVSFRGQTQAYLAREVAGDEREAYWRKATRFYPGYDAYARRCAPREIPVIILVPLR